jgi:hypothetical protein
MKFPLIVAATMMMAVVPAAQTPARRLNCLAAIDLPQKSFVRVDGLGLRNTYIWVDDIQAKFVGGYDPFDLFIVTGKLYSPFEMSAGKLERPAFDRLSRPNRNIDRFGPFRVPASFSSSQPPSFRFTVDSKAYQLRTPVVKPARFGGEDIVTIQVCRE